MNQEKFEFYSAKGVSMDKQIRKGEKTTVKIDFDFWVVWVLLPLFLAVQLPGDVQAADEADPHHRAATAIPN